MAASTRIVLAIAALLVLGAVDEAQRGRGGRGGGGRGRRRPAAATAPAGGGAREPGGPSQPLYLPQPLPIPKLAPPGPAAKAAPAKKEPETPVDPMTLADDVTAYADYRARVDEARRAYLAEHFTVCDLDANGWLSLRECQVTLALTREEYQRADANRDGRLDLKEFTEQDELLLARLGTQPVPPPAPAHAEPPSQPERAPESAPAAVEPAATPETEPPLTEPPRPKRAPARRHPALADQYIQPLELLARYDLDHSRGLNVEETTKLFVETRTPLSPELVVAQMDTDDSGELQARELGTLAWIVSRHMPESMRPVRAPVPTRIEPGPAEEPPTEDPEAPPAEPVSEVGAGTPTLDLARSPFARLDRDHDGFVHESELRALLSPVRLDLRLGTLLAALDMNGDGRLSEEEFRRRMNDRPPEDGTPPP